MTDAPQEGTPQRAIEVALREQLHVYDAWEGEDYESIERIEKPWASLCAQDDDANWVSIKRIAEIAIEVTEAYYRNKGVPIDALDSGRMEIAVESEEHVFYVIVPDAPTGEVGA